MAADSLLRWVCDSSVGVREREREKLHVRLCDIALSLTYTHTTYTLITAGTNDVYMRLASQNWAEGVQGTMEKILSAFREGMLWSDTV